MSLESQFEDGVGRQLIRHFHLPPSFPPPPKKNTQKKQKTSITIVSNFS